MTGQAPVLSGSGHLIPSPLLSVLFKNMDSLSEGDKRALMTSLGPCCEAVQLYVTT